MTPRFPSTDHAAASPQAGSGGQATGRTRAARRSLWLLLNLVYAAALAAASLMSDPPVASFVFRTDWLAHGVAYGCQTLLLYRLFARWGTPVTAVARSAVAATVFGTALEGLQSLQPARSVELTDILANGVGVAIGMAVICILRAARPGSCGEAAP